MIHPGEMLGHAGFPDALIEPCTTVLAILSPSERDLVRVVVEVINELRDSDLDGTPSRDGLTLVRLSQQAGLSDH